MGARPAAASIALDSPLPQNRHSAIPKYPLQFIAEELRDHFLKFFLDGPFLNVGPFDAIYVWFPAKDVGAIARKERGELPPAEGHESRMGRKQFPEGRLEALAGS